MTTIEVEHVQLVNDRWYARKSTHFDPTLCRSYLVESVHAIFDGGRLLQVKLYINDGRVRIIPSHAVLFVENRP